MRRDSRRCKDHGTANRNCTDSLRDSAFRSPRSPNSSGSSASSTKRLRASPPPKPTPKRTSKTPAPSLKATSNPSSPSAARGGWRQTIGERNPFHRLLVARRREDRERIRLITAKNVKMGYLRETPMEFIAPDRYEGWMTRGIPRRGDVLFTTEAPLANVAQLDTDEKVVFAQRIIIMQPDVHKLDSTFLKYLYFRSRSSNAFTQRNGSDGTRHQGELLKTIEISFPKSVAEQKQIFAKLDALVERNPTPRIHLRAKARHAWRR